MRLPNLLLFLYLAVWVSLAVSLGAERPANDPCAEAMTTVEMRECLNTRYKQVDDALNHLYQQLLSQLSKTRQTKLREAQQAWMLFRDKSAAFVASETEGGDHAAAGFPVGLGFYDRKAGCRAQRPLTAR